MKIGKRMISLLLGAITTLSIAGCSNSVANSVVATVEDVKIYRWEVDYLYNSNKSYYENMAEIDLEQNSNLELRQKFRESLLNDLIKNTATVIKAKATGYDLTEAENAEVEAQYAEFVEKNIQNYVETEFSGDANAREKATKRWEQSLKDNNLTREFLLGNMKDQKIQEKLSKDLYQDLMADESTLKESYDTLVADQKKKYEDDLESYTDDAAEPSDKVLYNPAGYIRVKHILVAMPEAIDKQINALSKEQGPLIIEMASLAVEKGESDQTVKDIDKKIKDIEAQIKELQTKGIEEIKSKAEDVYKKLQEGESFETLLEQHGEDPNMNIYPFNQYGYLVCEKSQFAQSFVTAALELKNPGDESALVSSVNGYHIIKLIENVQEGAKPFEEVKDFLVTLQLAPQQIKLIEDYGTEAVSTMKVEIYPNKL